MSRRSQYCNPKAYDRYDYRELLESCLLLNDSDLRKSRSRFNVDHWAVSRSGVTPMKYQMDLGDGSVETIEYKCDLPYIDFDSGFDLNTYVKRDSKYMRIDAMTGQWVQLSAGELYAITHARGPGLTIECSPDKILPTWIADADRCLQQAIDRVASRLDHVAATGEYPPQQENEKSDSESRTDPVVVGHKHDIRDGNPISNQSEIADEFSAATANHKRKAQQDEDAAAIEAFSRHKRHKCCREKSGCYSEHKESDVRDHLEPFDKLIKEYFELTDKAKLKGNELRQLSAKLRQGGSTLTYRNLTDCCQARFCKTQPSGAVVYHGLRLK